MPQDQATNPTSKRQIRIIELTTGQQLTIDGELRAPNRVFQLNLHRLRTSNIPTHASSLGACKWMVELLEDDDKVSARISCAEVRYLKTRRFEINHTASLKPDPVSIEIENAKSIREKRSDFPARIFDLWLRVPCALLRSRDHDALDADDGDDSVWVALSVVGTRKGMAWTHCGISAGTADLLEPESNSSDEPTPRPSRWWFKADAAQNESSFKDRLGLAASSHRSSSIKFANNARHWVFSPTGAPQDHRLSSACEDILRVARRDAQNDTDEMLAGWTQAASGAAATLDFEREFRPNQYSNEDYAGGAQAYHQAAKEVKPHTTYLRFRQVLTQLPETAARWVWVLESLWTSDPDDKGSNVTGQRPLQRAFNAWANRSGLLRYRRASFFLLWDGIKAASAPRGTAAVWASATVMRYLLLPRSTQFRRDLPSLQTELLPRTSRRHRNRLFNRSIDNDSTTTDERKLRFLIDLLELPPRLPQASVAVSFLVPNVRTHDDKPLELRGNIVAQSSTQPKPWEISAQIESLQVFDPQRVRLGSIDVLIGGKIPATSQTCGVRMLWRHTPQPEPKTDTGGLQRLELLGYQLGLKDNEFNLPIMQLWAGGVETLPNGASEPPLIVDLGEQHSISDQSDAPFSLQISEDRTQGTERGSPLRLTLKHQKMIGGTHPAARVLYFSRQPFMVAMLRFKSWQNLSPGAGREIAYWEESRRGVGWSWRQTFDGFDLILPPQGMGEEMEKIRDAQPETYRLDSAGDAPTETGAVTSPNEDSGTAAKAPPRDIVEGELVDVRFTPPTILKLAGGDVMRRFGATPWELPSLLDAMRRHRLVGLPLQSARFELLYGVNYRIRDLAFLRVAEVMARYGEPLLADGVREVASPELQKRDGSSDKTYIENRDAWVRLANTLRGRLAVYEVFDDRQEDFAEDGSLKGLTISGDTEDPRVSATIRNADETGVVLNHSFAASTGAVDPAFAGSFAWAYESKLLFEALWDNEYEVGRSIESFSATVTRLYFSALGGWGSQEASFNGGLSVIAANVDMGRVSELRVERHGRIAVFWNKAKLVTVFRRTVLPTDQFASQQDKHYGRAVLRKVEEYIEFTEKERSFPEPQIDAKSFDAACVTGCLCDQRIPVDSRWGRDYFDVAGKPMGWAVPLYVPGVNDVIYGHGDVLVRSLGNPESDHPDILQRIENLDKVRFWTDLKPGKRSPKEADSDNWAIVPTIDRPTGPIPTYRRPDDDLPFGAHAVPEGLVDFTFRLGRVDHGTNVVGRFHPRVGTQPGPQIASTLRYATLYRGPPPPEGTLATDKKARIEELGSKVENLLATFDQLIERPQSLQHDDGLNQIKSQGLAELTRAQMALKKVQTTEDDLKAQRDELCGRIRRNIAWAHDQASNRVAGLAEDIVVRLPENPDLDCFNQAFDETVARIDGTSRHLHQLVKDAKDYVNAGADQVRKLGAQVQEFRQQVDKVALDFKELGNTRSDVVEQRLQSLKTALAGLRNQANQPLASVDLTLADAQHKLSRLTGASWWKGVNLNLNTAPLLQELDRGRSVLAASIRALNQAEARVNFLVEHLESQTQGLPEEWNQIIDILSQQVEPSLDSLDRKAKSFEASLHSHLTAIDNQLTQLGDWLKTNLPANAGSDVWEKLKSDIGAKLKPGLEFRNSVRATIFEKEKEVQAEVKRAANDLSHKVEAAMCGGDHSWISTLLTHKITDNLEALLPLEGKDLSKVFDELKDQLNKSQDVARAWLNDLRRDTGCDLHRLRDSLKDEVRKLKLPDAKLPTDLALPRAWGNVPAVPQLDFTEISQLARNTEKELRGALDQTFRSIAYDFKPAISDLAVDITPVRAVVDDLDRALGRDINQAKLKASAVATDVHRLTRQIEADAEAIGKRTLDEILADFGGLKLDKLIGKVPIDDKLKERIAAAVDLKQGFDKRSRQAWVESRIRNLRIEKPLTVFDMGVATLTMKNPVLDAAMTLRVDDSGRVERKEFARISADWELSAQNQMVMVFEKAALECRNGQIRLDLDPKRLRLSSVLQGISDLLQEWSKASGESSEGPFTFRFKQELPDFVSASCHLALEVPPFTSGGYNMAGLSLGASFGLKLARESGTNAMSFDIFAGLNLASEANPFTMTITWLGGAAWVDVRVAYRLWLTGPNQGKSEPNLMVSLGLGAAAGAEFDVGWARGRIWARLNLILSVVRSPTRKSTYFKLQLVFAGRVVVFGWIDITISIILSLTYTNSGGLIGEGRIRARVKIAWKLYFKVDRGFRKQLSKGKGGDRASLRGNADTARIAQGTQGNRLAPADRWDKVPLAQPDPRKRRADRLQYLKMYV